MATSAREAAGLAYVCANLTEIRGILRDDDVDPALVLDPLLAAVRDGKPVTELLDKVHQAVQHAGDSLGIYGDYGAQERDPSAVGTVPMEIVFRCPLGKCMGRPFAEVTQISPHCSVNGAELVRERLL